MGFPPARSPRDIPGWSCVPTRRTCRRSGRGAGRGFAGGRCRPAGRPGIGWTRPAPKVHWPPARRSGPSTRAAWCPSTRSSTAVWSRACGPDTAGVELRPSLPDARGLLRPPRRRFQPVRSDSELLDQLATVLGNLNEGEPCLSRQLFWDGRTDGELALELGACRQAVSNREQKLLRRLRSELMLEGGRLSVGESNPGLACGANAAPRTAS